MLIRNKLNNLTVTELKEKIKNLGGSGHSKFNKEELIDIYQNLVNNTNINVIFTDKINNFNTIFNITHEGYNLNSVEWKKELFKKGWTVVKIPDFDSIPWKNLILSEIEKYHHLSINKILQKTNYFINDTFNLSFLTHHNIIWNLRKKCKEIFKNIWKDNNLLCSFQSPFIIKNNDEDIINFQVNQNHNLEEFICVEGLITFEDNLIDNNGGLIIKSIKDNKCYKILTNEGNIILYDSRLHKSIEKPKFKYFLGLNICMQPKVGANEEELSERKNSLYTNNSSSNWCYGPMFKTISSNINNYFENDIVDEEILNMIY
jgi:hypothetical protein